MDFLIIDFMVVSVLLVHILERRPKLLRSCLALLLAAATLEIFLVPHYGPFAMLISAFLVSTLMAGWFAVFFAERRACSTGLIYLLIHGVVGTALAVFTIPTWQVDQLFRQVG